MSADHLSYLGSADAEIARTVDGGIAALERVERFLAAHNSPEAVAQRARDLAFLRGEISERFPTHSQERSA